MEAKDLSEIITGEVRVRCSSVRGELQLDGGVDSYRPLP